MIGPLRPLWERLGPEKQRFVRFGIVGVSGVGVNIAFMAVGMVVFGGLEPGVRDTLSSILGIAVSIFTNFLLNDWWTWGDRKKGSRKRDFAKRLTASYIGAGVAAGLQFGTFAALRHGFDMNAFIAQLCGIALGMVVNYLVHNLWVFRHQGDPAEPTTKD